MLYMETQGDSECGLASLACVLNQPLSAVRKIACKAAHVRKWASIWNKRRNEQNRKFQDGIKAVVAAFAPSRLDLAEFTVMERLETDQTVDISQGKGMIRFVFRQRNGHCAAFEDGYVLDPNFPDCLLTLEEYRAFMGSRLGTIHVRGILKV